MSEAKKPDHVYRVVNSETGKVRLVRAIGVVAARNHAADKLFEVTRLTTGEALDAMTSEKLQIETAGEEAQNDPSAPEGDGSDGSSTSNGGTDGDEK